ncbi:MAG: PAS domain S-box protein [Sneathiella sp.]
MSADSFHASSTRKTQTTENSTPVFVRNLTSRFQKIDDDSFEIFSAVVDLLPLPIAVISLNDQKTLHANSAGADCFDNTDFWTNCELDLSTENTNEGLKYEYVKAGQRKIGTLYGSTISYFSEKRGLICFCDETREHFANQRLIEKEKRLLKYNFVLGKLARKITISSDSYEDILDEILEMISDALEVETVSIWDKEKLQGRRFGGKDRKVSEFGKANHQHLGLIKTPTLIELALSNGIIDATEDGWQKNLPDTEKILLKSSKLSDSLLVAIQNSRSMTGYLQIPSRKDGGFFNTEDKTFAVSVASIIGRMFEARKVSQIRNALARREEEYRAFIDHAPISSLVFDESGVIRFISSHLTRLMGYTADEVVGQPVWRYIHPSDVVKFEKTLTSLKQGEAFYEHTFKCLDSDGSWRRLEANGRDMRQDDIIEGYIVGVRDVSERYNMSMKLEQTKMELRAIVDASQASVSLVDEAGNIQRANKVFGNKWSVPVKEAIARNALEIVPQDQFDLTMKGMEVAKRTGAKNQFIFEQNGYWFETSISLVKISEGAPQAFVISTTDITDVRNNEKNLRDSEARLRDIAEYATDWFWEADEELNYSYLSDTTDPLLGGTISKGLGSNILTLFCDNPSGNENVELSEILKARQPFRNLQRSFSDNGKTVYVVMAGKPLFAENGFFIGYRGTGKNITSEILAMQQAQEVERKLFQSQKMEAVGQLTGGVAHDFNNLLAIICGNIELLKEQLEENSALSNLAGNALAAVDRGASLTQRLLAFSRKQVLVPQKVHLPDLVDGMKEILSRALAEDIEIITSYGENIWPVILDAAQMENSLLNMALNARDAMSGGGRLTLSLMNKTVKGNEGWDCKDLKAGDYVSLTLSDTGAGIDPATIPYIFDPFYSTKAVGKGTGLGLSMVFGFVGQSNGHIFARSEMSKGSSFELLFPRNEADVTRIKKEVEPVNPSELPACKILLVEDDEAVRAVTYRQLASNNCDVKIAGNAKEAIEILKDTPEIDLLLTDIILPGNQNGLELAQIAKKNTPQIEVLCMSGYLGEDSLQEYGGNTEVHFIGKPYRRTELLEKIQTILDSRAKAK